MDDAEYNAHKAAFLGEHAKYLRSGGGEGRRLHLKGGAIREAIFTEADLTGASLRNTILRNAGLTEADLTGAAFTEANGLPKTPQVTGRGRG
jgi:uncharacterized protein YjbI with pentapeptide repeats